MTIQESIYARLNGDTTLAALIDGRLFPDVPSVNTQIPMCVYWTTGSEPPNTLGTSTTLTRYTVQVESWAKTLAEVNAIQAAVKSRLHLHQGGNISRAFLASEDTSPEDDGYHGQQTFNVWYTAANIASSPGSTATITTGDDEIKLQACGNELKLDCSGLTLNGSPVGEGGGGESPTPGQVPIAGHSPGNSVLWWNDASEGGNMGLVYTTPYGLNIYLYD